MKLEIELDLNKIDYDAINIQIQEKIQNMNLEESYQISSKIKTKIDEEVGRHVENHLLRSHWSEELNDESKHQVQKEIREKIREIINPSIEGIFEKIPKEELDKMIIELIPRVLVDLLTNKTKEALMSYYCESSETITRMAEDRVRNSLGHY